MKQQKIRIAINGLGRIGRALCKLILQRDDIFELVLINELAKTEQLVYLLKYDTKYKGLQNLYMKSEDYIEYNNQSISILHQVDLNNLDLTSYKIDILFECTGQKNDFQDLQKFIDNGCKKVIISAVYDKNIPVYVKGVNTQDYNNESIISNGSCTLNCITPFMKVLDAKYDINHGAFTTIHSYTNEQTLLDNYKDTTNIRYTRSAGDNIVPTSTNSVKYLDCILPGFEKKFDAYSVRVPVSNVSLIDMSINFNKNINLKEIKTTLQNAVHNELKNIVDIDYDYKVSQDISGNSHSAIIVDDMLQVINNKMLKCMLWYDNEYGYVNRLIDMALFVMDRK